MSCNRTELTGSVDEKVRHSLTKLADFHSYTKDPRKLLFKWEKTLKMFLTLVALQ